MRCFEALGLRDEASPDQVKLRYKDLARVHHPDHGGDPERFAALASAYKDALAYAKARKCEGCNGEGTRLITRGFVPYRITCSVCSGTGRKFYTGTQK